MKQTHQHIDKFLPYGELIRGFANQSNITQADLKRVLRSRGIFFNSSEKETLVPCISTILLSPSEFDDLRELQNTREDNVKKNTSRIEWNTSVALADALSDFGFDNLIPDEGANFWFSSEPRITIRDKNPNKISIDYEIERNDLNKSWYEVTNTFKGRIDLEKISDHEIKIVKSYTSAESDFVGDNLQKAVVVHFKKSNCIQQEKELVKILFGDFVNEDRIIFFYRLSTKMSSIYFEFKDIINIEFKPDESTSLPETIDWMRNKSELKLKGNQIHDTFFIKEKAYHPNLQFWEMESSFNFTLHNRTGSCNVIFAFKDFTTKGDKAEFEINISNFSLTNGSEFSTKEKSAIKNQLLDLFEQQKDDTYKNFIEYLKSKEAVAE